LFLGRRGRCRTSVAVVPGPVRGFQARAAQGKAAWGKVEGCRPADLGRARRCHKAETGGLARRVDLQAHLSRQSHPVSATAAGATVQPP